MKLIYRIVVRISLILLLVLSVWAAVFYVFLMDEVKDELGDSIEQYSEKIDGGQVAKTDVKIQMPDLDTKDFKTTILKSTLFLYGILLLSILLVNIWVFQSSVRPLYKLLQWLDHYTVGKKNPPLDNKTSIKEFTKLNEAVIRNALRAEQLFEEQKQFIGNASHELQTPLAICQNRLEVLANDSGLNEEQLSEILKVQESLRYSIKLNKSLLLLSKIENRQFLENSNVSINALVKKYVEDYAEVYAYKNISFTLEEKGEMQLFMNESLALILISNLLKNAYVHTEQEASICVEIQANYIVFKNEANGIALDEKRIFERFYQEGRQESSMGLGLAIVDSICKMYNLTIRYTFENEQHNFIIE